MVIVQNLSKNGEMLKNVGENIKTILLHLSSFTLWILKILFLTQSFTNIFLPSLLISVDGGPRHCTIENDRHQSPAILADALAVPQLRAQKLRVMYRTVLNQVILCVLHLHCVSFAMAKPNVLHVLI